MNCSEINRMMVEVKLIINTTNYSTIFNETDPEIKKKATSVVALR